MTNHPGRTPPAWVADAEALAASRIAATRWPEGDGLHVLTRARMQQVLRDTVVWAYGEGLRAQIAPSSNSRAPRSRHARR